MLPEIRDVTPLPYFTAQKWQTVLLRNYGLVPAARLAAVLETDEKTIHAEARRLGLEKITYNPDWQKLGYINIIKNNWNFVPYEQLLTLLDMDEGTLDYCLKEDDFLGVKLGSFKAKAERVVYTPLTDAEIAETERQAAIIRGAFIEDYAKPFDFYSTAPIKAERTASAGDFDKIAYSYSMLYGDTFLEGEEIVPDELLLRLQAVGVNGLWMQGVLSKLSPYPFVKGLDEGYEIRRENLNKIIAKCKQYGIGVYLYFNEPRGLAPDQLTPETEPMKGNLFDNTWSLCTTRQPVKDYLYSAVKSLVTATPDLAGIITITMSENMTNCHSRPKNNCPHCSHLKHQDVVPEVNNIIQRAITDTGVKTRLLANLWAWTAPYGWSEADILEGIERMDPKIDILSVSEMGGVIMDGRRVEIEEYAISKIGPCEETKKALSHARALGHKVMAKVQINSSWEMAIVPYIPVFDLIMEHMGNLKELSVGGLMLSWTVGGYPTVSLDLVNRFFAEDFSYDAFLADHFGENAACVKQAVKHFSDGFRYYPHTIPTLYDGVQELGPSNLLYEKATGYTATMVTFAYDDYNTWRGKYSLDEWLSLLDNLLCEWKKGLDLLNGVEGNAAFDELYRFAEVIYINLRSMVVQTRYNVARDAGRREELPAWLAEEKELTKRLYRHAAADARIGYEASNHYYFTQNNFLEKLINLDRLMK
ncbi:MAG: hypothetical protein IJY20_06660 [Clostridia bacterium]|nr:hypothetical protein [Clostridia bacterium]